MTTRVQLTAVRVGIAGGLFVCVVYPLLNFAPLPGLLAIPLAALLGPALAIASYGLQRLIDIDGVRVSSRLGMLMNSLAGALLCAMLLVQLGVRESAGGEAVSSQLVAVWLGLDVAWDTYIGLGTVFFAIAMLRHPRFGRRYAFPGLLVGVLLLILNFYTFPTPPAEAGSFDLGPLVGLWYLVVTIQCWRSLAWARSTLQSSP